MSDGLNIDNFKNKPKWRWEDLARPWCKYQAKKKTGEDFEKCMKNPAVEKRIKSALNALGKPSEQSLKILISQLRINKNQLQAKLTEVRKKSSISGILPDIMQNYPTYKSYTNRQAVTPSTMVEIPTTTPIHEVALISPVLNNSALINLNPTIPPELSTKPEKWVATLDKFGRVTLTAHYEGDVFILDYNTTAPNGNIYKTLCIAKGYKFGIFKLNYDLNTIVEVPPDFLSKRSPFEASPVYSISTAAVLPTMISCDNINNVSIVFGSNTDLGFELPQDDDCDCTIDFTFDYMLKYNAAQLIECANNCGCLCSPTQEEVLADQGSVTNNQVPCVPAIFNEVTLSNIFCPDFITFVATEPETELLLNNFQDSDNLTEEYQVWQSDVNQLEPSVECCEALGGEVIPVSEWGSNVSNSGWGDILTIYNMILAVPPQHPADINTDLLQYINQFENDIVAPLEDIISQNCVTPHQWGEFIEKCPIEYEQYITTNNICSIFPPQECALWAYLLWKSNAYYQLALTIQQELEDCVETYNGIITQVSEIDIMILDLETDVGDTEDEADEEEDEAEDEENTQTGNVTVFTTTIGDITLIISEIDEAITVTDPDTTDCDVYSVAITDAHEDISKAETYCRNLSNGRQTANQLNACMNERTAYLNQQISTYTTLLNECGSLQEQQAQLREAQVNNNTEEITQLEQNILELRTSIDDLIVSCGGITNKNIEILPSQKEGMTTLISNIATLLNVNTEEGIAQLTTPTGYIQLNPTQKTTLSAIRFQQASRLSRLNSELKNSHSLANIAKSSKRKIRRDADAEIQMRQGQIEYYNALKASLEAQLQTYDCCEELLVQVNEIVNNVENLLSEIHNFAQNCYNEWLNTMYSNYEIAATAGCGDYLSLLAGVEVNFKLFVDTGVDITNPTLAPLESLSYGDLNNPIWTWDACDPCTGVILDGTESDIKEVETVLYEALVANGTFPCTSGGTTNGETNGETNEDEHRPPTYFEDFDLNGDGVLNILDIVMWTNMGATATIIVNQILGFISSGNYPPPLPPGFTPWGEFSFNNLPGSGSDGGDFGQQLEDASATFAPPSTEPILFEPCWETFKLQLPACVCNDLRSTYPDRKFYIGIEIKNYDCPLCLLVDNIEIDITDCETQKTLSFNQCPIPQISCIIDNKKSWVYTEKGIEEETIYPAGPCSTGSSLNYTVSKMVIPESRLWQELEYRYTEYDVHHSDLILNTKSATFAIDPANAIECDVYNFWKEIDCDECPTSCISGDPVVFESEVYYTGNTLSAYTLNLSGTTTPGLAFSCETYTDILTTQVSELKNDYYILTSDYNKSLNASYNDLLSLGGSLSLFEIQDNNCNTNNIVIGNNKRLDNLFGIITEDFDGTISFWESYLYSGTTPHTGGDHIEIFSGVTAQTFNQTSDVDKECCETLNNLLTNGGVNGLGIEKEYKWDDSVMACTWTEVNDCQGDCEYSGFINVNSISGVSTGKTCEVIQVPVCINPLDYLEVDLADINVKQVFDEVVISNLIDVKSRQTISGYPMLQLFYQLYLNANNCGKDLSGKLTYNTVFEFMDKIGDYWLDLIEQVVPATTIWEGCDSSGKLYRNTIFDQNKYAYRKYALNYTDSNECPVSAITNNSIGEAAVDIRVKTISLLPTNPTIETLKSEIRALEEQIYNAIQLIDKLNTKICALSRQDTTLPVTNFTNLVQGLLPPDFDMSDPSNTLEDLIEAYEKYVDHLMISLETDEESLTNKRAELKDEQEKAVINEVTFQQTFSSCDGIATQIMDAKTDLKNNYTPGTGPYFRQFKYLQGLRDEYNKCNRKANTQISEYNTVFITQIYDSNEYEGNVWVTGDSDWNPGDASHAAGPFFNTELIHNCDNG